jgi:hypothetical protein
MIETITLSTGSIGDNTTHRVEFEQVASRGLVYVLLCSCGWTCEADNRGEVDDKVNQHVTGIAKRMVLPELES